MPLAGRLSSVDTSCSPPEITIPRRYNAAVDLLDRHLQEGRGDKIVYVDARGETTYRQLAERTNRAGNALRALGVQPEQRVLIAMLDGVDLVATFLGAIKLGAVPVPVNTMLTPADHAFLLADSRATVMVASEAIARKLEDAARGTATCRRLIVAGDPGREDGWESLLDAASADLEAADTCCDDIAFWLYSSGSTGAPKGTLHTHAHLVRTAALYGAGVLGVREDDVIFSAAKLFFAYGLGNSMTFVLHAGATAVLLEGRPTPAAVLGVFREHRPSIFCGVPTLFASLLADPSATRAGGSPRLRVSISAGEALPKHIGERWKERFGSDILDGIGSTEMLHIFLSNRAGDIRYGTSGKPVPGYHLKLLRDDGADASDGEEGSLWVEGSTAAVGYWNNRERSLATFHGPWTRTGDCYVRDEAGYYTYAGRADDMIKAGGIWVSPFEVESALGAHDAVFEVAVVGHGDVDGLVKPKAFVVLRDPSAACDALAAELAAFVKTRLAPWKYPRWVEFRTELPKTATGKIQRFRLRDGG